MFVEIFKTLLLTSIAGSLLAAVLMLIHPLTRKYFGAGWHYYMWLMVFLVMVLPVRFAMPQGMGQHFLHSGRQDVSENAYESEAVYNIIWQHADEKVDKDREKEDMVSLEHKVFGMLESKLNIASALWIIVAAVLFIIKLICYMQFKCRLIKNSEELPCPEIKAFTKRKILVKKSKLVHSPIMFGIKEAVLVLPWTKLEKAELSNVLAHEMTHLKRHDIVCKWFVVLVKCIHWFNPVVYIAEAKAGLWCEISCDLAVVERMSKEEKLGYVNTILALISAGKSENIPLTTSMLGSKETLKRRFIMIKNVRIISKKAKLAAGVLATVVLAGTLGATGVMANDVIDTDLSIDIKEESGDVGEQALYGYVSEQATTLAADTANEESALKLIWPCPASDTITAAFGRRVHPVTGVEIVHNGIDIKADTGSEVCASISGTVISSGWDDAKGYVLVISDGNIEVMYAHLSEIEVEEGDSVTAGQTVAKSGNSGMSTGPHLHYEVMVDGEYINPTQED